MGSCYSRGGYSDGSVVNSGGATQLQATKVVTPSGQLRQYWDRVTAGEALLEPLTFLCSSDLLFFGEPIASLPSDHLLHLGQIYFVLPDSMLQQSLSASEMKMLAGRASSALAEAELKAAADAPESRKRKTKSKKAVRVSPTLSDHERDGVVQYEDELMEGDSQRRVDQIDWGSEKSAGSSSSMRKRLQRSASRRAKRAMRSFKMRLTTIQEDTS